MSGLKKLDAILAGMRLALHPDIFVFATIKSRDVKAGLPYHMRFEEEEGTTLILRQNDADKEGLIYEFPCRMITLNVHSALDAVGFMAMITQALAAKEISVNPVSGFYHDHLFIPEDKADQAMGLLNNLSQLHKD